MTTASPVRSVTRAIDLLMVLTEGPQSLRSICVATNLSKGTGHRILAGLAHRGLVIQDPMSGLYMLGPACFRIVNAIGRGVGGLGPIARPVLERLNKETSETVTLHLRMGDQRICVEELPSPHAIRYTAGIGTSAPIHVGAAGKTLLAFSPPADVETLLDSITLVPLTEHTISDRAALCRELDGIRGQGWGESHGERVPGASAVTAPVFDEGRRVIAVLSILGPDSRMPPERIAALARLAQDAAHDIAQRIARVPADGQDDDT